MRDLTEGSISKHLFSMAAFIGFGLLVQTAYVIVDLYFVAHLGGPVVAGVAAAASTMFAVLAASQLVSVGALSLISQAAGRKDAADGQLIFEQALSLGIFAAIATLLIGYSVGGQGVSLLAADAETAANARIYFYAFLPSLAIMFPGAAFSSALRATGVVAGPMVIQSLTVIANIILAPILIAGWGTGHPMGAMGAGLASSIAAVLGALLFIVRFNKLQAYLKLHVSLAPDFAVWRRIAAVGLPSTGEFSLIFIIQSVLYWAIRHFGAEAQAGFGIGSRVSQAIFLPAMAIAFAASPIAGQNFGARRGDRVRATFRHAAIIGSAIMLLLTLLCHVRPDLLVRPFTQDPAIIAVSVDYLQMTSWNFVAMGIIFATSGMFQALGNTLPSLVGSGSRLFTFAVPVIWLSFQPWATLHHFWYVSVGSVTLQALTNYVLLRRELNRKLVWNEDAVIVPEVAIP